MLQATLTTGVILLLIWAGLLPTHIQQKQRVTTGDDPHGLKLFGMPKANHKYLITDLPSGSEVPAEYKPCGNGVHYQKERVRGVDVTSVMVHFRAEGDFEPTGDLSDLSTRENKPIFDPYLPLGWVSLTFTLHRDSFTPQEVRLIRAFPLPRRPGTDVQWTSGIVDKRWVRVDRSWVDKDPYVAWQVLPESQLSHLIFRIRLPNSTKACLESKK